VADAPADGKPAYNAPLGTHVVTFGDDGVIPNSRCPLVVRQGAMTPDADDPAATFERVFAKNGWTNSWRDGVFDYHHYHSTAHEVLGIASGLGHPALRRGARRDLRRQRRRRDRDPGRRRSCLHQSER